MTDETGNTKARLGRGPRLSAIWLVPLVALIVGIWMVYTQWASQGPLIEITFVSGEGIEAGKTKVKLKNVEVGEVLDLRLSEDAEQVVLSIRIEKHAENLLRSDTMFWVVRPRIGKGAVSGLGTLLSGAYIELSPGTTDDSQRSFEGLESPPLTPVGTPGLHVTLDSDGNRALNEGDPILFHGMSVGTIEYVHFNSRERRTYYNAFIEAPFDRLLTDNTRFWFSSGIGMELSADGVRIDVASLETLILGGVAFDVPDGQPLGERITERAFYTIYPREGAINEQSFDHALSFVVLFNDSIRGLSPGAPVEYRGVRVGRVLRTDIDYPDIENLLEPDSRIPVVIEIEPARLGFPDTESVLDSVSNRMDQLIAGGLSGGLATGNLLTGGRYVELQYNNGLPGDMDEFAGYRVIPSLGGQFGQLLASVENTMATIDELPLDQIAASANDALNEMGAALGEIRKSATQLENILADPAIPELMSTLNTTLVRFQALATDFSEGSLTHRELRQSLKSLEQTLTELKPLLNQLRKKPNSLIFGGDDDGDLEPKGVQ